MKLFLFNLLDIVFAFLIDIPFMVIRAAFGKDAITYREWMAKRK